MTPYQRDQLEILRRIAERGKALAEEKSPELIDIFVHMLDEIERTVKSPG